MDNEINKIEEKISLATKKIEEKKKEIEDSKRLKLLQKEYENLTYPERHPYLYKISNAFSIFRKKTGELQQFAGEYTKKNPWD